MAKKVLYSITQYSVKEKQNMFTVIWRSCVVQKEDGQEYSISTDFTENCPSGFRLYQSGRVRACGRPTTSIGISSVFI